MLLKAAMRSQASKRLAGNNMIKTPVRSMVSIDDKAYLVPESVTDIVKFMDIHKPTFTCLYFHAAWNPYCEKVDFDYEKFTNANASWTHIKVDCDATPKVKLFFDARYEPQIILLVNGAEIRRQVGFNFDLFENLLEETQEFHYQKANYIGDTGNQWERFYDAFDRFEKDGHADRDAMRMMVDG